MSYKVEEFIHEGVPVTIYQDDDPGDTPRDWCNVGEMVCWHRRYELGDRQPEGVEVDALERGGMRLLARYLTLFGGATVVIPLGLYDHSGISMYAGGGAHWSDAAGWDSGTVGFIYDTPESRQETGCDTPELIEQALRQEVETYDQYLRGDVYGYVAGNPDSGAESHHDSLWGMYGLDYCIEEAKQAAHAIATDTAMEWLAFHQQFTENLGIEPAPLT